MSDNHAQIQASFDAAIRQARTPDELVDAVKRRDAELAEALESEGVAS